MIDYDKLIRYKLLGQIYESMTEEEKKIFVHIIQSKDNKEIIRLLKNQSVQLENIGKKQNSVSSYLSDLLANFTSAGVLWLGSKLIK